MSKPSTPKPSLEFTPRMQDAQARNKDPYASSTSEDEAPERYDIYGNDTHEFLTLRREAAVILDTPELLMMHAQARGDSIPATRHYFMKQLCGHFQRDTVEGGASSRVSMGEGGSGTGAPRKKLDLRGQR